MAALKLPTPLSETPAAGHVPGPAQFVARRAFPPLKLRGGGGLLLLLSTFLDQARVRAASTRAHTAGDPESARLRASQLKVHPLPVGSLRLCVGFLVP